MSKLETMKVADLKKLATSYGISKNDIDGHGVNGRVLGTDYITAIEKYEKKTKQSIRSPTVNKSPSKTKVTETKTLVNKSPSKTKVTETKTLSKTKVTETKPIVNKSPINTKILATKLNDTTSESTSESKSESTSEEIITTKKVTSPPKKLGVNKKCGEENMTNVNNYTKCEDDKICNVSTGRCIANTNVNKKNKSTAIIDERTFVGDKETIDKLSSQLKRSPVKMTTKEKMLAKRKLEQEKEQEVEEQEEEVPKKMTIKEKMLAQRKLEQEAKKQEEEVPKKMTIKEKMLAQRKLEQETIPNKTTKETIKKVASPKKDAQVNKQEIRETFIKCITK